MIKVTASYLYSDSRQHECQRGDYQNPCGGDDGTALKRQSLATQTTYREDQCGDDRDKRDYGRRVHTFTVSPS